MASSAPPTSLYVTVTSSGLTSIALLLPTPKMPPSPGPLPLPIRPYARYQKPPSNASGIRYSSRNPPIGLGGRSNR